MIFWVANVFDLPRSKLIETSLENMIFGILQFLDSDLSYTVCVCIQIIKNSLTLQLFSFSSSSREKADRQAPLFISP